MRHLIIMLCCFILSSCGVRPLNDFDKHNNLLTQIELGNVSGEKTYLVKNQLINTLNPYNEDNKKLYIIDVTINSTNSNSIVQKDSTILEKTTNINLTYTLRKQGSSKELTKGNFVTKSSFFNTVSPYGSFVQENKAFEEALKLSITNLKRKLLIFFAKSQQNKK